MEGGWGSRGGGGGGGGLDNRQGSQYLIIDPIRYFFVERNKKCSNLAVKL